MGHYCFKKANFLQLKYRFTLIFSISEAQALKCNRCIMEEVEC